MGQVARLLRSIAAAEVFLTCFLPDLAIFNSNIRCSRAGPNVKNPRNTAV